MTSPISVDDIFRTLPAGNLTEIANQIRPIGAHVLEPVQNANAAWKRLDESFQVSGLDGVAYMLEPTEHDAEEFRTGLFHATHALEDMVPVCDELTYERQALIDRVTTSNYALKAAQYNHTNIPQYGASPDESSSALKQAESDIAHLRDDITRFNHRVVAVEQDLADQLTSITQGTEVRHVGGATTPAVLTTWDGRVEDMRAMVMSSTDPSFLESIKNSFTDFVNPGDTSTEHAMWGSKLTQIGTDGVAAWFAYYRHGRFAPRDANGRYTSYKHLSRAQQGKLARTPWRNWREAVNEKAWSPKRGKSKAFTTWSRVGKVARPVGTVLGFVEGATDQWAADKARDYDLDERIGRAATRSAAKGVGALGGTFAGAKAGALVGSLFGPAGTVVGGLVGGVIGGVIGSDIGSKVADRFVDSVGKWVGKITFWD